MITHNTPWTTVVDILLTTITQTFNYRVILLGGVTVQGGSGKRDERTTSTLTQIRRELNFSSEG